MENLPSNSQHEITHELLHSSANCWKSEEKIKVKFIISDLLNASDISYCQFESKKH